MTTDGGVAAGAEAGTAAPAAVEEVHAASRAVTAPASTAGTARYGNGKDMGVFPVGRSAGACGGREARCARPE
ncbi:hypothetical protein Snoj_32100 [Streptomyces nojiriensis]|uniref:Uncharacterized protein n=1 Tax=Streptomyces nojiriensis TaxID=66374 RepID=A0ABQ3SMK3_9ACTN|nr:hypothetical protein GCM10010205_54280 [Streptomyces nojiriensis]GHI69292.1 hypothetical protein Snoj_32100 [Streptomyces nojiriensis]